MEFELTLRGNTDELPPLLELLGKNSVSLNIPSSMIVTEPGIQTKTPWDIETQMSLWRDLSGSAQVFMTHLVVGCDEEGNFGDDWECLLEDEDGALLCGDEPCRVLEHRRLPQTSTNGVFVEVQCNLNAQSIGARLANIQRTLSDPKYAGLEPPINKYNKVKADSVPDSESYASYELTPVWARFVFDLWFFEHQHLYPEADYAHIP